MFVSAWILYIKCIRLATDLLNIFVGLASMLPPARREECIPRLERNTGLETLNAAVADRVREMSPRRAAMAHAAFNLTEDPDGTQGGTQALKWWEKDCESRLKALKKAEGGVARQAKKIRDKEIRDKAAEEKRAKAKSLAAAKALAAPIDNGEPIAGVNAWVLYAEGDKGALNPIDFKEGADWVIDGEAVYRFSVPEQDLAELRLDTSQPQGASFNIVKLPDFTGTPSQYWAEECGAGSQFAKHAVVLCLLI